MRILLAEDDPVLCGVMQKSLAAVGHRVDVVGSLAHTRMLWKQQPFDAVLLDLNLGDGSGLDALREARSRGDRTPVLVLTARNRTDERIAGLDAGADDYLGKPFELAEVEARLRALVRRAHGTQDEVQLGGLRLDRVARRFFLGGSPFEMPAREFEVLWELMTPPGRVVHKRELSDKLSDLEDALGDNALEAFVSRLRKRLAASDVSIRTLRGLGYVIETASR
jgi:two-component system OmpR family response regulator